MPTLKTATASYVDSLREQAFFMVYCYSATALICVLSTFALDGFILGLHYRFIGCMYTSALS